jgi:hypothetical protein
LKELKMKKVIAAASATLALGAATIGLAAPAMAASTGYQHGGYPLDCSVHVLYQGADVDVNWC